MPYSLDPQVAGELGEGSVLDTTVHPPVVTEVDYVLDQPEADELIQSFPVFLVSSGLADRFQSAGLTGFTLEEATTRPSFEYLSAFGQAPHREYRWLRVHGTEQDDCWIDSSAMLCVSDRMMEILNSATLSDCLATKISPI
jgi:hypothetical protein